MSSESSISLRGLSKTYTIRHDEQHTTLAEMALSRLRKPLVRPTTEQFRALDGIDLDVPRGDVLGIIGRNGAGKSTLLKVLSRITPPTAGHAVLRGRVGSLLEVGTGFHPELTGRENIYLNGTILGMRHKEVGRHFDEIVQFAEVERFLDTPVKRYSSGMYVRLAFAVAAHLETDILLVDEVLAVGDLEFQRRCLGKVESLADEGRTVLFVSHSMETVGRLCRSAVLLRDGRVAHMGGVAETIDAYVRGGQGLTTHREWPTAATAPGDRAVRLRSVSVEGEQTVSPERLDIRCPVSVTVDYDVHEEPSASPPLVSLFFRNAQGSLLFATNDQQAKMRTATARGRMRSVCTVPGNLLAEGAHLVSVMIATLTAPHLREEDVVSFEITDPGLGDSVRGQYTGEWVGLVRPMLPWQSTVVKA